MANLQGVDEMDSSSVTSPADVHDDGRVSVGCQTEPNLIDKLIGNHVRKQLDDVDLYQEYVRSAQCAQFWPLDKNPIRSLVPSMINVDLPEQHLKNESLIFDLVQAIKDNSKLVNLLAKYIHHIVPNVIISKRIDLIPLITCTIRVCRDTLEQERLISLLFNLIKRPNEEQRRMIIAGLVVVLQVSPNQNSSLLLPNLWDHVNDKFPERRILLAESCASLAHYVRPIMRTKLILSILIQLLKDKNAAVRSAACKSFACLLTLIMDRNDEVFDACMSATEDIIQDVLQQAPVNFCEHRYELEQMRSCAIETIYPLICMWAVKLNRFKVELAEFYLAKADKYFATLVAVNQSGSQPQVNSPELSNKALAAAAVAKRRSVFFESRHASFNSSSGVSSLTNSFSSSSNAFGSRRQSSYVITSSPTENASHNGSHSTSQRAIEAYLRMLNYLVPFVFSEAVHSCAWLSKANLHSLIATPVKDATKQGAPKVDKESENKLSPSRDSATIDCNNNGNNNTQNAVNKPDSNNKAHKTAQAARIKPKNVASSTTSSCSSSSASGSDSQTSCKTPESRPESFVQLFDRPLKFSNKLLDPALIIDESAIVAFHDQLEQEHMIESVNWILGTFLPKFLTIVSYLSHKKFHSSTGSTNETIQDYLISSMSSIRQLCLLFGKHLTRTRIRPIIRGFLNGANPDGNSTNLISGQNSTTSLYSLYIASLTSFEPIEQHEFEEIVISIRQNLSVKELTRNDVETLAISIKIIATNSEQIHSPSTRQKFLTYILDALVNHSIQTIRTTNPFNNNATNTFDTTNPSAASHIINAKNMLTAAISKSNRNQNGSGHKSDQQQSQTKEFTLIIFRHILTCLVDPSVRPSDWAHILLTKFLPLLISLANDSADVYVCTYARLMCAQLVEAFDTYLNEPKLTKQTADAMLPALNSLKGLTEQIKASNLRRQIECLIQDLNERFAPASNVDIANGE